MKGANMNTKTSLIGKWLLCVVVVQGLVWGIVGSVCAQGMTATFQEGVGGYSGCVDTNLINKTYSTNNYGDWPIAKAYGTPWDSTNTCYYMLLRFDDIFGDGAGQIPSGEIDSVYGGAQVKSATLHLTAYRANRTGSYNWMSVFPMYTSWVEGTASGDPCEGTSCFSYRCYRDDGLYTTYPEDAWGTDGDSHTGPVTGVDYNFNDENPEHHSRGVF